MNTSAQNQIRLGVLPSINFNQKIDNSWDINFKIESRHFIFDRSISQDDNFNYEYSLSDFSALAGKKVGLSSKITFGVLTRIEPAAVSYRTLQQYILNGEVNNIRVAHRIAADQTFSSLESTEFRLRYRLSTEIPFAGLKADVKEFYFKVNTEALNSIQDSDYDLELRLVPHIGYIFANKQKIEIGIDNRLASFLNHTARFTSWITINWYL